MVSELLEVERRYRISSDDAEAVRAELERMGFSVREDVLQRDTYFNSTHRDLITSEECVRIREEGGTVTLTWKPPSTSEMHESSDFWKEEVDLVIGSSGELAHRMLSLLDFVPYVVVEKLRSSFDGPDGVEISIDRVVDAGVFLEIEVKSRDRHSAQGTIERAALSLGLSDVQINKVPYRDLVKAAQEAR